VPAEHAAGIVGIQQAPAGEPGWHAAVYLLGYGGKILRCEGPSAVESDLPVAEGPENALGDAVVDMEMAVAG
jgi:hypothetical protein